MNKTAKRLAITARQIRSGDTAGAWSDVSGWLWSERKAVGLCRDLTVDHTKPGTSSVALTVVPLDRPLADQVFDATGMDKRDRALLERRQVIWEAGFDGGFVAVDVDGAPAFLQWFLSGRDRERIRSYWGPLYPTLDADVLLAEGAWVPPDFRGQGVMGDAMHLLTEEARRLAPGPVRSALTFVEIDNRGALKGCQAAGYEIELSRGEQWRLGRRTVRFEPTRSLERC